MANDKAKSAWELEHGRPGRDVEKSHSDDAQNNADESNPDEGEKSAWEPEPGIDSSMLYSPNITPTIPKSEWKEYILQAAKEAIHIAETRGQVYMLVRNWDEGNQPRVPALDLAKLTEWAIETWAPYLK